MKAKIDAEITLHRVEISEHKPLAYIDFKLHPMKMLRPHAPELTMALAIHEHIIQPVKDWIANEIKVAVETDIENLPKEQP